MVKVRIKKMLTHKGFLSIAVLIFFIIIYFCNFLLSSEKSLVIKIFSIVLPSLTVTLSVFSFLITIFISDNLENIRAGIDQKEKIEKYKKDEEKLNKDNLLKKYTNFESSFNSILNEKQNFSDSNFDYNKVEDEIKVCNDFMARLENYLISELKFYFEEVNTERKDKENILNYIELFADIKKIKNEIEDMDHNILIKLRDDIKLVYINKNDDVSEIVKKDRKEQDQTSAELDEMLENEKKGNKKWKR
ncbi:hypothetical protein [Staphylococcus hominis]|uniref:hypothetical protein n=1 Tax=Staphylococcus hominis TaxID=1290 RepID=UPI00287A1A30|nr:hypothetical protein [Staphylococcus hominis]MDS3871828.1 hypothetical protein [Staphylococcus hominis]